MVLIVVAVHKGLVVVDKSLSDTIEAITVVELASQPCLDLAFILPLIEDYLQWKTTFDVR